MNRPHPGYRGGRFCFPPADHPVAMRLGQIIDAAERLPQMKEVRFAVVGDLTADADDAGVVDGGWPGELSSYRGWYDRLAIEPAAHRATVADLLRRCRSALTEVFHGYKGGEYRMNRDTLVYVARWGECPDIRPLALEERGEHVALIVARVEGW